MAKDKTMFDVELDDLPSELRWREWMGRIEAVLFASASPVSREDLARVVGQGVSVDLLIEDVVTELKGRPYELMAVADGWMMRTRVQFAQAIRVASDVNEQLVDLNEFEVAVLAAVAYHQPLTRDGLKDIFGKDISRDLIGRLRARELITTGPRSPRAGAPYTYVTTSRFLVAFDLQSLRLQGFDSFVELLAECDLIKLLQDCFVEAFANPVGWGDLGLGVVNVVDCQEEQSCLSTRPQYSVPRSVRCAAPEGRVPHGKAAPDR